MLLLFFKNIIDLWFGSPESLLVSLRARMVRTSAQSSKPISRFLISSSSCLPWTASAAPGPSGSPPVAGRTSAAGFCLWWRAFENIKATGEPGLLQPLLCGLLWCLLFQQRAGCLDFIGGHGSKGPDETWTIELERSFFSGGSGRESSSSEPGLRDVMMGSLFILLSHSWAVREG